MKVQDPKLLNQLFNLAVASAKLRKIIIHQPKQKLIIRPQIHLLISGGRGTLKSTVLNNIAKHFNTSPYTDITEPALVGSIDKTTMQFLEGASWMCRNNVFILDEFEFKTNKGQAKGVVNLLLQLTEGNQYFRRKVAQFSSEFKEKDGDLFCKVHKGLIEVKTNFSLIIGTMEHLNFKSIKLQALKSRCVAIEWKPDFDFILNIAEGNNIYSYEDLLKGKKIKNKTVEIRPKDYKIILNYAKQNCNNVGDFLRRLLECCRVFAILGKHDKKLYRLLLRDSND